MKIVSFVTAICIVIVVFYGLRLSLEWQVHNLYYDKIGDDNSFEKANNFIIQEEAAKRADNLFILGSSEFEYSTACTTHVSSIFNHKAAGFQPYLIGRAGYDQLAHTLITGELGRRLHGKKIVLIISPQWFYGQILFDRNFHKVITPLNYYLFFQNDEFSFEIKKMVANELLRILRNDYFGNYQEVRSFCSLYAKNDFGTRIKRVFTWPYYRLLIEILKLKDDIAAYRLLEKNKAYPKRESGGFIAPDWQAMKDEAFLNAMARSNNNTLFIDDESWKHQLSLTPNPEGSYREKTSVHNESLYYQLDILLRLLHELDIDPLIIKVAFHGPWNDFAQLKVEERQYCYSRIEAALAKFDFKTINFFDKEYEPYFFFDGFHLGWVGWVYMNEVLYDYWWGKPYRSVLH